MRIVVLVKYVPDASGERGFDPQDHTTDRAGVDGILSELDEYAVEAALALAEAGGADGGGADVEVVGLTMGPAGAAAALKKALQMGAGSAVHVQDDALHGSDAPATSLVLARALEHLGGVDLVLAGMASTDATMSVVPAMIAERLGLPYVGTAAELSVDDGGVTARVDSDEAVTTLRAALPAVVTVTDQINEPRYPSFKGIMAAKKKPVQTLGLAELGVDPAEVGLAGAWTEVRVVTPRPPRGAGTVLHDDGQAGVALADFLVERKLA